MSPPDSLLQEDWQATVDQLGGAAYLAATARETKAFLRPRVIPDALVLLRLVLAYCLGERGLRATAAVGLADVSNVALLYRMKQCDRWLERLVGRLLASQATSAAQGRLIRVVDATTVPKTARAERCRNGVWRIHSAFDLPAEHFGHFELTDEKGASNWTASPWLPAKSASATAPICSRNGSPGC
jgi:hypothetical protein